MGHLQLFVVGMRCRRCVREVTARLRDIDGVDTVSADPTDGSVRLTGSMSFDDVLAALTGTEYAAHLDTRHAASHDAGRDANRESADSEHRVGDDSGGTAAGQPAT